MTSSSTSVPPSASPMAPPTGRSPLWRGQAPNRSIATDSSGRPAVDTETSGAPSGCISSCSVCARPSLPVPGSPRMIAFVAYGRSRSRVSTSRMWRTDGCWDACRVSPSIELLKCPAVTSPSDDGSTFFLGGMVPCLPRKAEELIHRLLVGVGEWILVEVGRGDPTEIFDALGVQRLALDERGFVERERDAI